jgi:hypothetical protein
MGKWLLFFAVGVMAEESFITPQEYARQLYHNPRGIGCHLCHGERGEGKVIARYKEKGEPKVFSAPPIRDIGFSEFDAALSGRIKGMPKYFLTAGERRALYFYLHPETEAGDVSHP